MYVFTTKPTEESILDLERHRREYRIFLNAIADNTISRSDFQYFKLYVDSYRNHPSMEKYLDFGTMDAPYLIGILELLDEEVKKSYERYGLPLSFRGECEVKQIERDYQYLCHRCSAKKSIRDALSND